MTLAVASEPLVRQYAATLVGKAGSSSAARVLALRAQPEWRGPEAIEISTAQGEPRRVLIRACMSALAVREAVNDRGPDDYLIVLTDRPDSDLGLAVLARCFNQHVESVDLWAGVLQSFSARTIDPVLRRMGWPAEPLVAHAPSGGWAVAQTGVLTRDHALTHLTATLLGLPSEQLDPSGLLLWTLDASAASRFREQPAAVQAGIVGWVTESLGPVAGVALRSASVGHSVDALALGLVADVLWPVGGSTAQDVIAARVRFETWTRARDLDPSTARAWADTCRGVVQRMADDADPQRPGVLSRATALFDDLVLPGGADNSVVLPAGFESRLRALAVAVGAAATNPTVASASVVESSFGDLLRHDQSATDRRTGVSRMAVRLVRWLALSEGSQPTTLLGAVHRQAREDAWVDRASADVWVGSTDPDVAAAWSALFAAVSARRSRHDREMAALLADATDRGTLPDGLTPIEDLIAGLVKPLTANGQRALLVVIDGMSTAVAAELADEALGANWYEVVPGVDGRRTATLAVLPTLTKFSRTSLFAGSLRAGQQADEKRLFPALAGGGAVFHKSDLVGAPGHALPPTVLSELASDAPIVAVVLNSVDDALAKHDPGGAAWTLEAVQHLEGLLEEARRQDRVVVLTSDHGHVVERGARVASFPGAEARWRPSTSGLADPESEVLLSGRRVLADGGSIIAPWAENLRYGSKQAGYHGGASAAEVVIPVIVLSSEPDALASAGWVAAAPQSPAWWNDQIATAAKPAPNASAPRKAPKSAPPGQESLGFEVPVPAKAAASTELVDALLASPTYKTQRSRAGARAMDDSLVRSLLQTLIVAGGRLHRDTLAGAANVAAARLLSTLTALRRLLNVEGYDVVSVDVDQVTVILDVALLREQFDLGSGS